MVQMLSQGKLVDVPSLPHSEVTGILLDNGLTIDVKMGTYREYLPNPPSPESKEIYIFRAGENVDRLMVGYTRNIIAIYYHSPWTPE